MRLTKAKKCSEALVVRKTKHVATFSNDYKCYFESRNKLDHALNMCWLLYVLMKHGSYKYL